MWIGYSEISLELGTKAAFAFVYILLVLISIEVHRDAVWKLDPCMKTLTQKNRYVNFIGNTCSETLWNLHLKMIR